MKAHEWILKRKLGAFELLILAFLFEVILGSTVHGVLLLALSVAFYFTKQKFKGEFSLSDLFGLVSEPLAKEPK